MENISDQKQIEHNTEAPNSTTAEEKESQEIVQEGTENNISEEITDAPPKKTLKKKLAFILILVALVCIGSILNTPPETVPLDRTNGAARPLKWCMVTADMVH